MSKLKTLQNRSAGFTLLEVLIASSIFAMIMILVVGVIAQTSSYQSKINSMRSVSEETRRLADQITRDVRAANGLVTVKTSSVDAGKTYKNGIAFFDCDTTTLVCTKKYEAIPYANYLATGSPVVANTLVLVSGGQYQIYWSYIKTGGAKKIYYFTGSGTTLTLFGVGGILTGRADTQVISSNETTVNLAGYGPADTPAIVRQPFVEFYLKSQTPSSTPVELQYESEIRSMVAGRGYN